MNAFLLTEGTARPISLHQLSALDASPVELIGIAGRLGCRHVCLFTDVPERARHIYPAVARADIPAVAEALAASSVTLCNLEVFPLDRDGALERFREGLEIGASLGASRATAHVHEAETARAADRFAAFAEYAGQFGIVAGLEFNAFSAVPDIGSAAQIVRTAGAGSLVLDGLHLVRSGGSAEDVAAVADLVGYCQLSDGPLRIEHEKRWREAVADRAVPGEGEFPLLDLIRPLRAETIFEVEVPQKAAMNAGISAEQRCGRAVAGVRRLIAQLPA